MPRTVANKHAWILKQNRRWGPLLDTTFKLVPIFAVAGGIVGLGLWTVFSAYLGQLGKAPLPLAQYGDWLFLPLFGLFMFLLFAAIVITPAAWTSMVRRHVPSTVDDEAIQHACRASTLPMVLAMVPMVLPNQDWAIFSWLISIGLGGLIGGFAMKRSLPPETSVFVACLGFTFSSFCIATWLVTMLSLATSTIGPFATVWPYLALVGFLTALLAACIFKPAAGMVFGLLVAILWVGAQLSPDGGRMVASALYAANFGGGRPAHIAQDHVNGEICNLAIDARPVWVFEPRGCERAAAFKRLDELKGMDSLARKRKLASWHAEVGRQLRRSGH